MAAITTLLVQIAIIRVDNCLKVESILLVQFHYLKRKLIQNRLLEKNTKIYGFYTDLFCIKPNYRIFVQCDISRNGTFWKDCLDLGHCMYLFYFMANTCYRGAEGVFIQIKRRQRKIFKKSAPKKFALLQKSFEKKNNIWQYFSLAKKWSKVCNIYPTKLFISWEHSSLPVWFKSVTILEYRWTFSIFFKLFNSILILYPDVVGAKAYTWK